MEIIGHRGCADQYPENTVTAVKRSAEYVDAIEVDVRRCASGELVVFHDETVDRLTEGSGRIDDLTWAELSSLEVLDSGETVPLLSSVLSVFPDGVRAQIELKDCGLAADLREVVTGANPDVSVSSFRPAAIEEVNELDWDVRTGYLFEDDAEGNLNRAVGLGCDTLHPHYDLCLRTDVVDAAHAEGMEVVAWKAARTSDEVAALRAAGVDGVTADRWDIA
ncbi:glycerophosphodiester phosphodiesterase [Halobaculum rarum]|uniref:glycerophosphodiester phosphodiesterase n=1 Tax=Halobaculum rarum TaxID=3075122 RepID=UPI0032AE90AC